MIPTMQQSGKGITMETGKRSAVTRCRRAEIAEWGEMNRQNMEDFQGSETTLHDTVIMDICHYTFVKNHKMYTTKSEL